MEAEEERKRNRPMRLLWDTRRHFRGAKTEAQRMRQQQAHVAKAGQPPMPVGPLPPPPPGPPETPPPDVDPFPEADSDREARGSDEQFPEWATVEAAGEASELPSGSAGPSSASAGPSDAGLSWLRTLEGAKSKSAPPAPPPPLAAEVEEHEAEEVPKSDSSVLESVVFWDFECLPALLKFSRLPFLGLRVVSSGIRSWTSGPPSVSSVLGPSVCFLRILPSEFFLMIWSRSGCFGRRGLGVCLPLFFSLQRPCLPRRPRPPCLPRRPRPPCLARLSRAR